ncbi:MAG: TrkH family potassium uptake protein [Flavobacteriales bacterium]|nr:TrkH family potassium uptake protein [Flavobacteriales bacterium]
MRSLNWRIILHIVGLLMVINAMGMLLCLPWSFHFDDGAWKGILFASAITLAIGGSIWSMTLGHEPSIGKREGFLVVTLGWLFLTLSGALPYLFTGSIPRFADAFFETVSGFTTTGASILTDIEALPRSILFWRSFTQWVGGMGIIVLTIAILPLLGIGGMQLFMAESPGPTADKIHPRIKETAKRMWAVYVLLTAVETGLLMFAEMDLFEALCHSFTTMATGGFSTRNASAAAFGPAVQYIMILFMFLAGVNFTLNYFLIRGNWRRVWPNEEFRTYLFSVLALALVTTLIVFGTTENDLEQSFRDGLFQIVSILTTTGFVTADYTAWTPFLTTLFFVLLFVGGSSGSTSGGVKIVRFTVVIKNGLLELRRILHPRAIFPVRLDKYALNESITFNILGFFLLYVTIFVFGSMVLSAMGFDLVTAIGATATSLGNVGPGIGGVGPMDNFAWISDPGKYFLALLMLIGRLEVFTVLVLFTRAFWTDR